MLPDLSSVRFVLTDIDDTLTDGGLLNPKAYQALFDLTAAGFQIVPVTGRPAGWCELIARQWPVAGVVGENGAFYFRHHQNKMRRHFMLSEKERLDYQKQLANLAIEIPKQVPGAALASDQFCRRFDLAIDFCEDVPRLPDSAIQKIVQLFENQGAKAKVSSIHVNGWFGNYDKQQGTLAFLNQEFGLDAQSAKNSCLFIGDSPNDEPMWAFFPLGVGVANIQPFLHQLTNPPCWITKGKGGEGFYELAHYLLNR